MVKNKSATWLDANWAANKKYYGRNVTFDHLIDDCRERKYFEKNSMRHNLSYFKIPDYVKPKNGSGFYYMICFKHILYYIKVI